MRRRIRFGLLVLIVAVYPFDASLLADESASARTGYYTENFELSDADLRDITSQVMTQHPLLSSSPGIKAAGATRHFNKFEYDDDVAWVVYFPHIETAGIKQAFQVTCSRQVPDIAWNCDEARIRRYVTLESQNFEVRVTGPIDSAAALALIEATRQALPPALEDGSATPETAINILPNTTESGYLVIWGDPEGHGQLMMQAELSDGADGRDPTGWRASIFSSDD